MVNLKPGQTEEEAIIESLTEMGFKEMGEEEKKSDWYPAYMRSILRILANDDTSIPAPNEDEELRAMGVEPPVD
jgi:hypothetical protein